MSEKKIEMINEEAADTASNESVYEIPPENAPLRKRLDNPVYLMCHPQMMGLAYLLTAIKSMLQIAFYLVALGYVSGEVCAFIALFKNYGFLR